MVWANVRICEGHLVDLLDAGAVLSTGSTSTGETTRSTAGGATSAGVQLLRKSVSFRLGTSLLVVLLRALVSCVSFQGPSGVWISLPQEPKSGFGFASAGVIANLSPRSLTPSIA